MEVSRDVASFQALLQSAPDAIVLADREGYIRFANQRAVDMFGYAIDELLGQRVELLVP